MTNRPLLGYLFMLGSVVLLGCDSETTTACVPDEVGQIAAALDERSLADTMATAGAAPNLDSNKAGEIRVYLDYSYSIRGYFRGATCSECQSKVEEKQGLIGKASTGGAEKLAARESRKDFRDSTFITLLRNLTSAPLKVVPGTEIQYYLFGEKVSPQADPSLFLKLLKDDECYRDLNRKEILKIEENPKKSPCAFDKDLPDKDKKSSVGSRQQSPLGPVFEDIAKNVDGNSLYIVASDFFFSNDEAANPNSTAVVQLAKLIRFRGMSVQLYGFQLPYKGVIDDVPGHSFQVNGQLPFYFMAIGAPATIARLDREMSEVAKELKVQDAQSFQGAGRYQTLLLGARDPQLGLPKVTGAIEFPKEAQPPGSPLLVNSVVQEMREIPAEAAATGTGITVRWTIQTGTGAPRAAIASDDFKQTVLSWRQAVTTSNTDCSQAWDLVPTTSLGLTPVTIQEQTLESRIFASGDHMNVDTGTTYLIQFALYSRKKEKSSVPEWLELWSSDNTTVEEDRRAAGSDGKPTPGAVIRTFNLKDFVDSLQRAVPDPRSSGSVPLATKVMAIRFQ